MDGGDFLPRKYFRTIPVGPCSAQYFISCKSIFIDMVFLPFILVANSPYSSNPSLKSEDYSCGTFLSLVTYPGFFFRLGTRAIARSREITVLCIQLTSLLFP